MRDARGPIGEHAQRFGKRKCVARSQRRIALERRQNQVFEHDRHVHVEARGRALEAGPRHFRQIAPFERAMAGQHLVEDDAHRVEIAGGSGGASFEDFRRGVAR